MYFWTVKKPTIWLLILLQYFMYPFSKLFHHLLNSQNKEGLFLKFARGKYEMLNLVKAKTDLYLHVFSQTLIWFHS